MFENQFSFFTRDLEPVCAGGFTRRRNENSGAAVWILKIGGDIVLDFNLMKPAQLAKAPDPRRTSAQPLQHIQVVRALIEQNAAALPFPGRPPAPAAVVGLGAIPIGDDPT